MMTWTSI